MASTAYYQGRMKPVTINLVYEDRPILRIGVKKSDDETVTIDYELKWHWLAPLAQQALTVHELCQRDMESQARKAVAEYPEEKVKRPLPKVRATEAMRLKAQEIIRRFL